MAITTADEAAAPSAGVPAAPGPIRPAPVGSKVVLALLAVYLIWGSTYLGLRFALESFPPFSMGGVRYLLAGLALYAFLRGRGSPAPTAAAWRASALTGTLLFALGNGLVAYAELSIPSGVAAIVVATTPLWAVLLAALWGTRPVWQELFGLLLGLLGVGLLQRGGAFTGAPAGIVAIMAAPVAWALGSVWGARLALPPGAMAAATQMVAGGAVMVAIGALRGEQLGPITGRAIAAFAYLVVFGSLVAFSAYQFLLHTTRPALATSYAFVNPAVALLLGALLASEPLTASHLLACALTGLAVLFVLTTRPRRR